MGLRGTETLMWSRYIGYMHEILKERRDRGWGGKWKNYSQTHAFITKTLINKHSPMIRNAYVYRRAILSRAKHS